jgi:hypothetical protein
MSFERIVTDEAAMVSVGRVGFLLLPEAQQGVRCTRMNFLHEAGNTTGDAGSSGRNGSGCKSGWLTPVDWRSKMGAVHDKSCEQNDNFRR